MATSMAQSVSATWAQRVADHTQHETRANDLATDGQENVLVVFQHQLTLPPTPGVYLLLVQDGEQAYRYRIWRQ